MNDLYGIDPAAPSEAKDLAIIAREFKSSTGRFIADFPPGWLIELRANLGTLPAVKGMQVGEVCSRLAPHSLLNVNSKWNPKFSWAENAISISDKCKALIGPSGTPKAVVRPIDEYMSAADAFPEAREDFFYLTPTSCVDLILPLLASSPRLVLVDPFFTTGEWKNDTWKPNNNRMKFLELMLESAKKLGKVYSLRIYWNIDRVTRDTGRLQECREKDLNDLKIKIKMPPEFDIKIRTYEGTQIELNHPRHLIGRWGAISFDKGFDFRPKGLNKIGWVASNIFETLYDRFYEDQD